MENDTKNLIAVVEVHPDGTEYFNRLFDTSVEAQEWAKERQLDPKKYRIRVW